MSIMALLLISLIWGIQPPWLVLSEAGVSGGPRVTTLYMHVASFHWGCCPFFPATGARSPFLGDFWAYMALLGAGEEREDVEKRVLKLEAYLFF